jgi:hypothetical protein
MYGDLGGGRLGGVCLGARGVIVVVLWGRDFETLVEDASLRPVPPYSSSKRSRAAEVHNLSEKVGICF